ncbi:hypothetical protein TI39_contig487g00003 [Zymoseptoria brevis]|uniref:Uncharacterized protein n=1 Tax=Zymoseptoria brevis TaxID=1047168 RepID=A0A0F4GK73_9PEZI|nr:hypothetical protein TI39_contig487g00003 [Zymoseptoria brevis]
MRACAVLIVNLFATPTALISHSVRIVHRKADSERANMVEADSTAKSLSVSKNDDLEYHEYALEDGSKCKIGRPKGSADAEKKAKEKAEAERIEAEKSGLLMSHGPERHYDLGSETWRPGEHGTPSDDCQRQTGVTWHQIYKSEWVDNFYTFEFKTGQTYDYYFKDATGKFPECNVWIAGTHTIDWSSTDGTIVQVDGY